MENIRLMNEVCQLKQDIKQIQRQPVVQLPEETPQQSHQKRKGKIKEN